eukprot:13683_1
MAETKEPINDPSSNHSNHEANHQSDPPKTKNETQDSQMTETSKKDHNGKDKSRKKDNKHKKDRSSSSRHSSTSYRSSRDRYRNQSRSRSRSRSHSPSRSRHRSRRSHRHRSRSPSYNRDRNGRRQDKDYRRRSSRHHHHHRREHDDRSRSRESKNCTKTGDDSSASMVIEVSVYPKSSASSGESKAIHVDVSRTSTVTDFKGILCARGLNVFLQYNLFVEEKELDVCDDRLLCVAVGIKPDARIVVRPKDENDPTLKQLPDDDGCYSADVVKKKCSADQIEMYCAYEEMFGVEEAAGMMGLDPSEVKLKGIELILQNRETDREAAFAARSDLEMSAANYYSEEMLFAQAMQAAEDNKRRTNENLVDFDSAPGTTHTAGGGTVSRPPPQHVSENACIFVGDLHPSVTRSDLLSVFSQIGCVQWIQLFDCHKQMNRPFNFAFVYFSDLLSARNAITTLNYTKFYGSPCRLMWKQEKNSVQWTDCNIIVKNLPPNTDSQLLHAVFSKFGKILSSKVKTTATGRNLPYGYVQYGSKESADGAIAASDRGELAVAGHLLSAEWFKSREDRAFRQIYVKNIPSAWSDEELLQLFEAQTKGKIKSFTVKHSPYGRWACISFHEPHHAVKAIENLNNCPTGDPLSPALSVSRFMYKTEREKESNNNNTKPRNHHHRVVHTAAVDQCYSIYVGNVPLQLTDDHMRQLFEPFGAVISAAVVQKTEDYKYGFVNFEQPEDAARALVTMNGKSIGNKTIQVKPANTDMSKAIAITQAANQVNRNRYYQSTAATTQPQQPVKQQESTQSSTTQLTTQQAKNILQCGGAKEKVWKVQYGEDWHEYDTTLAAIVEQLNCGEQIQITLADSNYIITRMQETQAMQKNCASGTMRKVVRTLRDI